MPSSAVVAVPFSVISEFTNRVVGSACSRKVLIVGVLAARVALSAVREVVNRSKAPEWAAALCSRIAALCSSRSMSSSVEDNWSTMVEASARIDLSCGPVPWKASAPSRPMIWTSRGSMPLTKRSRS